MNLRLLKDKWAGRLMRWMTIASGLIVFVMAAGLYIRSRPILQIKSIGELLFSSSWHPLKKEFGLFPFIVGSIWVTGVAVIIAVPLCLLTAIYLSEYAPRIIREWTKPLIDLLAGIPSVVYGVWGILVIVPLIKNYIAPAFGTFSSGYSVLAAGIVLAIMVFPIIIHVCLEVIRTVPREIRDASLSLGATKWQTIKHIVLRKAMPGIIAAVVLGLSRAFGETMAVLMVTGNASNIPTSFLVPARTLPATIAAELGEASYGGLHFKALFALGIVLFFFTILINMTVAYIRNRERK